MKDFLDYRLLAYITLATIFGALGGYLAHGFAPRTVPFATVDLTQVYQDEVTRLAQSEDVPQEEITRTAEALRVRVAELAQRAGVVLLVSQAVVAGVPDVTAELQAALQPKTEGGPP